MRLIGRDAELAALVAELEALKHGRGRALVLLGEPGAGKTALAEMFAAAARDASARVLWMAGRATGDTEPGWPWPAILREVGGSPELIEQLSAGANGTRLFEDTALVLANEAVRQAIVLVIDDADVLDDAANDLLVFVAEQLRLRPLVVLVTARDRKRIERLCRAATVIVLQGLGAAGVGDFLESKAVVADEEIVSAALRLTGGLPGELDLLARELASARATEVDDVFRVALDMATSLEQTQGRAAAQPVVQRLIVARDLAPARTRGEIALLVHHLGGTTSMTADERITLIEGALSELAGDVGAVGLRAKLHAALARELYHGDSLRDARDPAAEAAMASTLAQASGDAVTRAYCLRARHDIDWRPGTAPERLALVDEIIELLDGTPNDELLADAVLARFTLYLELGDPRVDREFDRFLQVASRTPTPRLRHAVASRHAMRELMTGDLQQAETLIDDAAESARRSGEPDGLVVAMNQRFELHSERGDRSLMLPTLERFRAVSSHPAIAACLALARLDAGDVEGARSAVAPYEHVTLEHLKPDYGRVWVLSMLGEIFLALEAHQAIQRTAAALLPFAGTNIVVGGGVLYHGAVDHHVGTLLVATGDHSGGIGHLRRALEMHQRLGAARWAQRTARALASMHALPELAFSPLVEEGAPALMVRDGEVWTFTYRGQSLRCKDAKGLRDLATLLANPGVDIPAESLAETAERGASTDAILDERARADIARRLRMLDSDIDRADRRGDEAASARAIAERDALINELGAATGLGGRSRRLGDPVERARKAVSARMHDAIGRIEQQHSELGLHLRDSVVIGRSCRYQPATPVHWVVRQNESGS